MRQRHYFGSKPNCAQRIGNFCHVKIVACQYFGTKPIRPYIFYSLVKHSSSLYIYIYKYNIYHIKNRITRCFMDPTLLLLYLNSCCVSIRLAKRTKWFMLIFRGEAMYVANWVIHLFRQRKANWALGWPYMGLQAGVGLFG